MIQSKQIAGGSPVPGTGMATVTTAALHVYANGTTGNDTNSGLDVGHPKLTLQAAVDLVPDIVKHHTVIHLAGTFTDFGVVYLQKSVNRGAILLVDGGSAVTIVDDKSGTNYTATSSSVSTITDTGASWTADALCGMVLEILTGPAAGELRTIHTNTAAVITPAKNFGVNPTVGATFRIVRPQTLLTASSVNSVLYLGLMGVGQAQIQRLSLSGTQTRLWTMSCTAEMYVSAICSSSSLSYPFYFTDMVHIDLIETVQDPTNPGTNLSGIAIGTSGTQATSHYFADSRIYGMASCYCRDSWISRSKMLGSIAKGTRFKGSALWYCLLMDDCTFASMVGSPVIDNSTGYATTRLDSSAAHGLVLLQNSKVSVGAGVDITANADIGIEVYYDCFLDIRGAVTGTNTQYGIGVYVGSFLEFSGTPTITGGTAAVRTHTTSYSWATLISNVSTWVSYDRILLRKNPFV